MTQNVTSYRQYMPKPRQVLAYMILPGIVPRLNTIGFRFPFVAAVMATLYAAVGLLPRTHPYLRSDQFGRFSVRQVFIESAAHLKFRLAHLDQIIMFGVLLAGFLLLAAQFILMALYLTIGVAQAAQAAIGFNSLFQTANPTNDIALMLLDRVFGVPGYFNSCISDGIANNCEATSKMATVAEPINFPEGQQLALQTLFAYFSMGALLLGGLIVAYYIIVLILESAHTGVPLGKRFASFYAPMRLCIAVLMLVPVPTPGVSFGWIGYNSAQYLTLYLAGIGSAFGTNLWLTFNNTFIIGGQGVNMIGGYGPVITAPVETGKSPGSAMVAQPKAPAIDTLLQFSMLARACRAMYELNPPDGFGYYAMRGDVPDKTRPFSIEPYIVTSQGFQKIPGPDPKAPGSVTYDLARKLVGYGDIRIVYGIEDSDKGEVVPLCGKLVIRGVDTKKTGAKYLQEKYFTLIEMMWKDPDVMAFGERVARLHMPNAGKSACEVAVPSSSLWGTCDDMPGPDFYKTMRDNYQSMVDLWVMDGHQKQIADAGGTIDNKILSRGWAGAGIWYNKLAELNGSLFDSARGLPILARMPEPMESVARQNRDGLARITSTNRYSVMPINGVLPMFATREIAMGLDKVYLYFRQGGFGDADLTSKSGSVIFDLMNSLFGTQALFDMRSDTTTNPMVQLVALGKSIVDAALFNIMVGTGIEVAGGALEQLDDLKAAGGGLNTMGDAWFKVASLGLGIGTMIYYVIPFLPFIYFFFAVVKWLQSIFEAMIGMPLWALAHLRIDGDGIPPDGAMGGYMLLFEIVLRPALTVIGMIASFLIFTALAFTMNDIFDLMIVNLTGYHPPSTGSLDEDLALKRGTIDQFFYTVVYTILVYMMAVSCFKLIDMIPKEIFRWIGSDAKNIIDETKDVAGEMIQKAYVGSFGMPLVQDSGPISQAVQGLRHVAEGVGPALGKGLKGAVKPGNKGVSQDDD